MKPKSHSRTDWNSITISFWRDYDLSRSRYFFHGNHMDINIQSVVEKMTEWKQEEQLFQDK